MKIIEEKSEIVEQYPSKGNNSERVRSNKLLRPEFRHPMTLHSHPRRSLFNYGEVAQPIEVKDIEARRRSAPNSFVGTEKIGNAIEIDWTKKGFFIYYLPESKETPHSEGEC